MWVVGTINIFFFSLIILMTATGAFGALLFKKASDKSDGVKGLIFNLNLYFGLFLYLISSVINIYVLKYLDYSIVLPLTSITYVWTMALSYFILKEHIGKKKILGVALILIGAAIISI